MSSCIDFNLWLLSDDAVDIEIDTTKNKREILHSIKFFYLLLFISKANQSKSVYYLQNEKCLHATDYGQDDIGIPTHIPISLFLIMQPKFLEKCQILTVGLLTRYCAAIFPCCK